MEAENGIQDLGEHDNVPLGSIKVQNFVTYLSV
jgi:hypothetical protein